MHSRYGSNPNGYNGWRRRGPVAQRLASPRNPLQSPRAATPSILTVATLFSAKRGVVPLKFALTKDDVPTCTLPASITSVTRTAGGTAGSIEESAYLVWYPGTSPRSQKQISQSQLFNPHEIADYFQVESGLMRGREISPGLSNRTAIVSALLWCGRLMTRIVTPGFGALGGGA
jgi:hypothetical protein